MLIHIFDMRRLKSSLTILLAICMIGYSSVWAFESHEVELNEVGSVVVTLMDEQPVDQHSSGDSPCDHSCHAYAHMLAVSEKSAHLYNMNKTVVLRDCSQNTISMTVSPDLRPPRV